MDQHADPCARPRTLGVAGTGTNLSDFLKEFIDNAEPGVTPIIVMRSGAIQAHRNKELIAINQAGKPGRHREDARRAASGRVGARRAGRGHGQRRKNPQEVATFVRPSRDARNYGTGAHSRTGGSSSRWSTSRPSSCSTSAGSTIALVVLVLAFVLLVLAFAYAVERLVLRPVKNLQHPPRRWRAGQLRCRIAGRRTRRTGDLSQAFDTMARQIRNNTEHLETQVKARTQALEQANQEMRRAHQQINDSIDYASLIRCAILPNQQQQQLGAHHFALWRPRDVVGATSTYIAARAKNTCWASSTAPDTAYPAP